MKITITLKNAPLTVTMEGADEEMEHMVDVATETLIRMRKIWKDSLKKQAKLIEEEGKQ